MVAEALRRAGCATLLLDLLTPQEASDRRNVFDIELLGERVGGAVRWLAGGAGAAAAVAGLPVGLFGASTGAAAALVAAAEPGSTVTAVVSRGGRPDLAGAALASVQGATLLIVGSLDTEVLELNRQALARLRCRKRLVVIEGATHLFEEPGALEQVAGHASAWFTESFGDSAHKGARPGSPGRRG